MFLPALCHSGQPYGGVYSLNKTGNSLAIVQRQLTDNRTDHLLVFLKVSAKIENTAIRGIATAGVLHATFLEGHRFRRLVLDPD
jgi:hypothetical protein